MPHSDAPAQAPDRKRAADRLLRSLWVLCAIALLIELLVHKHGDFAVEDLFGFHAALGAVACLALVLVAKLVGYLLKRPEDYYERD